MYLSQNWINNSFLKLILSLKTFSHRNIEKYTRNIQFKYSLKLNNLEKLPGITLNLLFSYPYNINMKYSGTYRSIPTEIKSELHVA